MSRPTRLFRLAAGSTVALASLLPLAAQACDSQPYVGSVCFYPGKSCPTSYVPADGSLLDIDKNPALYAAIATVYGGDGTSTFGLPDLRGRMTVGAGQGANLQPIAYGQPVGLATLALQGAQVPVAAHTHQALLTPTIKYETTADLPEASGNLALTAVLPASMSVGAASISAGDTVYLSAISGIVDPTKLAFVGPYLASLDGVPGQATLKADVAVRGSAGTSATTARIVTMTGGTVAINGATPRPVESISTQSPGLGMIACIAVNGEFPTKGEPEPTLSVNTQ